MKCLTSQARRVDFNDCGPAQPHAIGPRFFPKSRQSFLNRLVAFAKFLAFYGRGTAKTLLRRRSGASGG